MTRNSWSSLLLLLVIGCSSRDAKVTSPPSAKTDVIKVARNHKYNLDAILSGADVAVGNQTEKVIAHVTIRNPLTGNEIGYNRPDGPSESDSTAYDIDVWSPDDEFLVLPLNRFRGFCIIRATEAIAVIQNQSCSDTVWVRTETGTGLWHQFEKWDGNQSFIFSAGLSGDLTKLKYDISTGRLNGLGPDSKFFRGQNSKGTVEISPGP